METTETLNTWLGFDPAHPRPTLRRTKWVSLDGEWNYQHSQEPAHRVSWRTGLPSPRPIAVPFPPESTDSGVGNTSFEVTESWYERELPALPAEPNPHDRVLLHFGAVDYDASVWLNGNLVAHHSGGNTPFSADITDYLAPTNQLVVRAIDHPLDVEKHRGKQDWKTTTHDIWYERTTGIWQSAWLEIVPEHYVRAFAATPDVPNGRLLLEIELADFTDQPLEMKAVLTHHDRVLAQGSTTVGTQSGRLVLEIPSQTNGQDYEHMLWSPERPTLLKLEVSVGDDSFESYTGLRSVAYANGALMLNDRPYYMRSVLNQGYRTSSHLAAISVDEMRNEIELMKNMGFNAARLHQKVEDPRLAYFADVLGLLLWVEMPSAYTTSTLAKHRMLREWPAIVERFRSHPSVVTWVPFNESWGIQHIAHDTSIQEYVRGIWNLTKSLDPSRLVVSNDGWEMIESDIWSIHDYQWSGDVLRERYSTKEVVEEYLQGTGPAGRRLRINNPVVGDQPVMLTEFGGITYAPNREQETWGYSTASNPADFEERLEAVVGAVRASAFAGYCYTQLRDTLQEANGLVDEAGQPKLPLETFHRIFAG